jgi:hypothetical protein
VRIPRSRIGGAVIDEVELGIVGHETPDRAAADLPRFRRPARHPQVGALVARIERLEFRTDEHVAVGAGVVRAPGDLAVRRIERGQPAAHAEFAAAVADEHFVFHDERRHRHALAAIDVSQLRAPDFLAALGVDRESLVVERVEVHLAVRVSDTAVDDVAARDALRRGERLRLELPFHRRAWLRQVERVDDVRIRRHEVHRVADDHGGGFVAANDAGGKSKSELEGFDVGGADLAKLAVARVGVILTGHGPFGACRRRLCGRKKRHDRDHHGGEHTAPSHVCHSHRRTCLMLFAWRLGK